MKKIFLSLFLALSCFASYVAQENTNIILNNKSIGVLYKGANVTKVKNGLVVNGWVMDGNEYILFYSYSKRIKLLRIDEEFIKNYKVIKTIKDEYDVVWKNVSFKFNVSNMKSIVKKDKNIWANEEELYLRCGSCHVARTPNEYAVNAWPNVIKTMAERAGFTKDETKMVGVYMQYKALDSKK